MSYDFKFYESVIRKWERNDTIKIAKVFKKPAIAKGNNFLADVLKLKAIGSRKIEEKDEDCEFNFIIKEMPSKNNLMQILDIAFKNECVAYNEVIPTLNKFSQRPIAVPKCIFCNNDLIVLEDLGQTGFSSIEKCEGFTLEQITEILKELANLHAASIVFQHKNCTDFETLTKKTKDFVFEDNGAEKILSGQEEYLTRAIDLVQDRPETDENLIKILTQLKGKIASVQTEMITRKRKFPVINHGDLWSNNIMVNGDSVVKLVDLQIMRCTSVAADLSYFLYGSIHPDLRAEKNEEFLQIYLEELKANVINKKVPLGNELTMEWLQCEMREFSFFGFMYGMWLLPLFLLENKNRTLVDSASKADKNVLSNEHRERLLKLIYDFGKRF